MAFSFGFGDGDDDAEHTAIGDGVGSSAPTTKVPGSLRAVQEHALHDLVGTESLVISPCRPCYAVYERANLLFNNTIGFL